MEQLLENIDFSGNGLNVMFNQTPLNSVEINGDGADIEYNNCPIGYNTMHSANELDELEDVTEELECRVDDIKCAVNDTKAILDDIEPKVTTLLENLKEIDINKYE